MNLSIDSTIATAVLRYLEQQIGAGPTARAFVRIEGFGEATYAQLLGALAARNFRLAERELIARSAEIIPGHAALAIPPDRTATSYRNDLPPGQTLLLILNRRTSDAQSLKDLFAVTEQSLTRDGVGELISASFVDYDLHADQHALLVEFVRRLRRLRMEPQLRELAEFLRAVDAAMVGQPGTTLPEAIAGALPALGLFRCRELAPLLNSPRGDKLLRQLKEAAQVGAAVLDEPARQAYLKRLGEVSFSDEVGPGGLSAAEKGRQLARFVDGLLADNRAELLRVLGIDWHEVRHVLTARGRAARPERYSDLAARLQSAADDAELGADDALADVLESLRDGREPDPEALEQLLGDAADRLGRSLRNELRRLQRPPTSRSADFVAGLTALAVDLLHVRQEGLAAGAALRVALAPGALDDAKHLREAAWVFQSIYGGIEGALPAVQWAIAPLWELAATARAGDDEPDGEERERAVRAEIAFRVALLRPGSREVTADLIWQYRSDSPLAATAQTLDAEGERLREDDLGPRFAGPPVQLRVPIFNGCNPVDEIGDLDLSHPLGSLGPWYEQPGDLRAALEQQLKPVAAAPVWSAVDGALAALERAWGAFVGEARRGLAGAELAPLLRAYDDLLATCLERLQGSRDVAPAYRLINQAWMIGPPSFERWAVMPLLHPLKLLWWRERSRTFNALIAQLLDHAAPARIVDVRRFKQELGATFGSSSFPPLVALPPDERARAARLLPVEEAEGYELFVAEKAGAEAFGLDTDLLAEDENERAAQRAVEGISAVVQDYIETYPFVRDGVEIFLYDCRNGALPGMLIEQLTKIGQRRGWSVRLTIVVHTRTRGAPLFRRASKWLAGGHQGTERQGQAYFPPITVKVLQAEPEALFRQREDTDIVILADVLAERGQQIVSLLASLEGAEPDAEGYLPTYRARQEPFQREEQYRRILLSPPQQPALSRRFLLAQHAALERRAPPPDAEARFYRELSLEDWSYEIEQLHRQFNWVICYDTSIDRFLLQAAFREQVQVIRYSLGLGAKGQHNLTVSSSGRAQAIVTSRLATRLRTMFPNAVAYCQAFAERLVQEAKEISGDIVLRAAGPGAFLNELIGLVAAKFATERRFRAQHPEALRTWILLDDFEHWFGRGKFPDLLLVASDRDADGGLLLRMQVLEAKCVGEQSFAAEAADAQEQVRCGVRRLAPAFAPGAVHLDAPFWYDQLYRAVAGNLVVAPEQQELWELFRDRLHGGAYSLDLSGHSWAFCYDGQAELSGGPAELPFALAVEDAPEVPLHAHHYGRNELAALLLELIGERDGLAVPPEVMEPLSAIGPQGDQSSIQPGESSNQAAVSTNQAAVSSSQAAESMNQAAVSTNQAAVLSKQVAVSPSQAGESMNQAGDSPNKAAQTLSLPPALPGGAAAEEFAREQAWLAAKAGELERALRKRGVQVQKINPADADVGPSIVRFKLRLSGNETIRKIQAAAEDLARDLALASTPIIDNVLRTNFVGVDIPRERSQVIELRPLLDALGRPGPAELPIIVGVTPDGTLVSEDLSEFPHLLVAGATNSGKSVFLRSLLLSLLRQYPAGALELLIVDPKRTDFTFFNSLPYLRGGKVIVERGEARDALLELVRDEMPRRQNLIANRSMKVKLFNQRYPDEALPPIVALIDEYALLVSMMDRKEREAFEQDLMILAAAARSVGIHLVLATQRPSADIVTSTLKANLDARIAFRVASPVNSRVVLDATGAENLLGRGDMLFRRPSGEVVRLQAPFMGEEAMIAYLRELVG